jgi:hypothetical protein
LIKDKYYPGDRVILLEGATLSTGMQRKGHKGTPDPEAAPEAAAEGNPKAKAKAKGLEAAGVVGGAPSGFVSDQDVGEKTTTLGGFEYTKSNPNVEAIGAVSAQLALGSG